MVTASGVCLVFPDTKMIQEIMVMVIIMVNCKLTTASLSFFGGMIIKHSSSGVCVEVIDLKYGCICMSTSTLGSSSYFYDETIKYLFWFFPFSIVLFHTCFSAGSRE